MLKVITIIAIIFISLGVHAEFDHIKPASAGPFSSAGLFSSAGTYVAGRDNSSAQSQSQSGIETTFKLTPAHPTAHLPTLTAQSVTTSYSQGVSQVTPGAIAGFTAESHGFSGGVMGYLPPLPKAGLR
jgi:hypothetical protein